MPFECAAIPLGATTPFVGYSSALSNFFMFTHSTLLILVSMFRHCLPTVSAIMMFDVTARKMEASPQTRLLS